MIKPHHNEYKTSEGSSYQDKSSYNDKEPEINFPHSTRRLSSDPLQAQVY